VVVFGIAEMVNTYTYFIQSGEEGPIKIGRASDVYRRLKELQTGSAERLRVIAVINGDHERSMHEFCNGSRIGGEWFNPSPTVWRCIDNFAQPVGSVYDVLLWMRQLVRQYYATHEKMLDFHTTAAAVGHERHLYKQISESMGSMEQTIRRIEKCLTPAFAEMDQYRQEEAE
jgi:hypothetical protein